MHEPKLPFEPNDISVNSGEICQLNTRNVEPAESIDPASLKLSQNYNEMAGVAKVLTTVPVRKPNKQDFVRVHENSEYRIETMLLVLKEERETYSVAPPLWQELSNELTAQALFTTINRLGTLSLWPVKLPNAEGHIDQWSASALEAVSAAQADWVRVVSNMSLGAYEVYKASGNLTAPEWPAHSFREIFNLAFKGRHITSLDHPVVRRLRGDV